MGAGYEWLLADCDAVDCGDRARSWLVAVLLTAPLIPLGAALAGRGAWLPDILRVVCLIGAGVFGLIGVALLVAATGVTESGDDASSLWLPVGLFFLAVAGLLVVVRRRLRRT